MRDSGDPAGKMGEVGGGSMPNSCWKRASIVFASSKSSVDPARCGCVAYARDAFRALSELGTELKICQRPLRVAGKNDSYRNKCSACFGVSR